MAFFHFIINSLGSIINHLNLNSGLIAAIATVILVGITWRYVQLTDNLLKSTYRPQIVVSLHISRLSDNYDIYTKYISVENVGTGVARKLIFGGDLDFETEDGTPLNQIPFFKNGIDALVPGKDRGHQVTNPRGPASPPEVEQYKPVVITVAYEDWTGGDYDDEFTLDFNDLSLSG